MKVSTDDGRIYSNGIIKYTIWLSIMSVLLNIRSAIREHITAIRKAENKLK